MEQKNPQQAQKTKSKLFILLVQDEDGTIMRIFNDSNYDQLWLRGSTEAKAMRAYWTVFDLQGRFIDGNYNKQRVAKISN